MSSIQIAALSDYDFGRYLSDFKIEEARRNAARKAADSSALYIVLEHRNGTDCANLHTNGAGYWTNVWLGKAGADKHVAELNEKRNTFRAVLLNSNEARTALHQTVAEAVPSEQQPSHSDNKIYGSEATLGEFYKVVEPVMEFINNHFDPNTRVIIDTTTAQILSGLACHNTMKFVKD